MLPDLQRGWPILSENCLRCHGPDPSSRDAGLRVDLDELATAELPQTPGRYASVPGSPGEARNEIDRFVLARLDAAPRDLERHQPSPSRSASSTAVPLTIMPRIPRRHQK